MTTVQEETFVIDLPAPRTHSLRIAGRRIRSQKALKAIFLEERGARRPSVFVSSTATQLAALADVAHEERGNLRLFLFEDVSPGRKEFLQTLFRTVVSVGGDVSLLDPTELVEVLVADNRSDLFIGGTVNPVEEVVVLYRGSLDRLAVPFTWFTRVSNVATDFSDFGVADHGHTLRFGECEVAADAILYDFDPAYRARARKRQLRLDESFGGSLRRLRELRGVLRSDFGSISEKTIARIERGEVEEPRERTLNAIARRLDVSPEELETY